MISSLAQADSADTSDSSYDAPNVVYIIRFKVLWFYDIKFWVVI